MVAVEDAGDGLHTQRNALDSGYLFDTAVDYGTGAQPTRVLAQGRDASATVDSACGSACVQRRRQRRGGLTAQADQGYPESVSYDPAGVFFAAVHIVGSNQQLRSVDWQHHRDP